MDIIIEHLNEEEKFYTLVNGVEAHLLYKKKDQNTLDFYSTYVPSEARGMGVAKKLVKAGIEYLKDNDLRVIPSCSYVEKYFEKNPEISFLKV